MAVKVRVEYPKHVEISGGNGYVIVKDAEEYQRVLAGTDAVVVEPVSLTTTSMGTVMPVIARRRGRPPKKVAS